MKTTRRVVSMAVMFFVLLDLISPFVNRVSAASTYNINGVNIYYTDYSSTSSGCWTYANNFYNKIWGKNFSNSFDDVDNSLRLLSDNELSLTEEHLKAYVSDANLGSVLRICNAEYLHGNDGWGHSQLIVQKDASGFTVFEGGVGTSSNGYRREKYYTWSQYCAWWDYDYIKYIKWPGANPYSQSAPAAPLISVTPSSNNFKEGSFLLGESITLTWDTVPGATFYWLNVVYTGDGGSIVNKNIGNVTSYTFTPSQYGSYWLELIASNSAGSSRSNYEFIIPKSVGSNWISDSSFGEETTEYIQGDQVYFNYKLHDEITGDLLYSYYNGLFPVTVSIIDPDGEVVATESYQSDDNDYISCICKKAGEYTAKAVFNGHEYTSSFTVAENPPMISSSQGAVLLTLGDTESETIKISKSGYYESDYTFRVSRDNSNVGWEWGLLKDGTASITIIAKSKGKTILTFDLIDKVTEEVLDTCTVIVAVSSPTYTITYNANGGTGIPSSQTKNYGEDLTLSSTKPTREGYTFLGWSTNSTATSATYQPGASFTANENTTLYAVWKQGCENNAHNYAFKLIKSPTANATGSISGICTNCSAATTVTLPKLNTADYTYSVTKAAACETTGTGKYTWKTTAYGSYSFNVTISATGHSYTSKVTAPACGTQGYTTHTCSVCKNSYKDSYTAALSHSYSYKTTKAPTTTATGTLTGTCAKCSGTTAVTLPKLNTTDYTYSVTKAAACETTGTGKYTWKTTTYGSYSFEVPIAAKGHSYSSKVTSPTCTTQGYTTNTCSACGDSYKDSYTDANGHSYTAKVTAPTCLKPGYTTYICSVCGNSYNDNHVDATGHSDSYAVTKTPTESKAGTLTVSCKKCGRGASVTLPMLNTTDYDYSVTNAAACETTGTGKYTWRTTTYGSYSFEVPIAAKGHSYSSKVTVPTCTAKGYTTHTCSVCSDSYKDSYSNPIGHSYSYTATKVPTVKASGILTGICSNCSGKTTATLPRLNNSDYCYTVIKEPSYNESGIGRYTWLNTAYGTFYFDVEIVCTQLRGDFDQDDSVTDADALYLLRYTLFPDRYPISQNGDVDGDGEVTDADALYLLRHTLFPERYPLKP